MKNPPLSTREQINYPKDPVFLGRVNLDKYPTFKMSWGYSYGKLQEINKALNSKIDVTTHASIIAAGSFGRLDANDKSDLDFFVVHDGTLSETTTSGYLEVVKNLANSMGIQLPNKEGAFAQVNTLDALITPIGSKEDNLSLIAQRLLILMECRPIFGNQYFGTITNKILDRYFEHVTKEPEKECLV